MTSSENMNGATMEAVETALEIANDSAYLHAAMMQNKGREAKLGRTMALNSAVRALGHIHDGEPRLALAELGHTMLWVAAWTLTAHSDSSCEPATSSSPVAVNATPTTQTPERSYAQESRSTSPDGSWGERSRYGDGIDADPVTGGAMGRPPRGTLSEPQSTPT